MSIVAFKPEATIELTEEESILVRRARAAIRRSFMEVIELGKALEDLKTIAGHGRFMEIVRQHLGLDPDSSAMFRRLARHEPFLNLGSFLNLPKSPTALDALRPLTSEQLEAAIASGDVAGTTTIEQANAIVRDFQRQITRPETAETGAAWNDIVETRKQHRPESSKCGAPVAPQGRWATQWPELCHLLIERRKALKIAQEALDDKILCGQGQVSKWEIPHQDDGRIPRADNLMDWVQALGLRIELVAVP